MSFGPANPAPGCTTLVELLRHRAATQPDEIGFTFLLDGEREEVSFTYQQLDQQARAIAAWLQKAGATGERALLLYQPGLQYIAAFFGCLYAGVTAVPAFPPRPNRPMPRLQTIVADGPVKFALTSSDILHSIQPRLAETPHMKDLRWLDTDAMADGTAASWQEPAIGPESLAFLQYTSGSTSAPRGVMLSHANLMSNLALIYKSFEGYKEFKGVFWLPPYHDMGLIGGILEPLYAGTQTILMSPASFLQSPFRWLDAISRHRAAVSGAPNFAYDLCVSKISPEQRQSLDLSSWQLAFNGAEPVRQDTLDRFARAFAECGFRREAAYPCYGLAEATLLATGSNRAELPITCTVDDAAMRSHRVEVLEADRVEGRTLVSSGRSPAEQQVLIVDPQTLKPCPADSVGEIWVQGPSVSRGYWNRPEVNDLTFAARLATGEGPFLRTGDLGFVRDGELFVTGRAKDLIILHGKNHYPQDIEQTVEESHAAVRQSCAAAFSVDVDDEECLVVVAEVERSSRHANLDEALQAVRSAVAVHHDVAVDSIVLIRTLSIPKTSSGKIQRHLCKERFLAGELEVVAEWKKPRASEVDTVIDMGIAGEEGNESRDAAAIQAWLVQQIAQRLNLPLNEVDPQTYFPSFGMDSLTAMMLVGDLEEWLGRALIPTLMYDYPSIVALAEHLAQTPAVAEVPA
ncbi:MAG: AMP-binding protein [Planctomycetes bacterium]|nr:AMP-binding protein [Planctomycetota bacterium]